MLRETAVKKPSENSPPFGTSPRTLRQTSDPIETFREAPCNNVWAELVACERLRQTDIDWFIRKGVPPLALARSWDGQASPILRDIVVHFPGGRFEFARYAPGADNGPSYVLLVRDRFGEPSDLVAWNKLNISTWLGVASMLGEDRVVGIRLSSEVLINSSPLTWLARGRSGVFIVDPKRAVSILRGYTMRAENVEQARWLRQIFEVCPPRILALDSCGWV